MDYLKLKNRQPYLDALKALSSFLVIIYHFSDIGFFNYEYKVNETYFPGIGKILLGFSAASVPLFFLINGILTIDKKYSLKTILFKVLSIIKIYIIWGLVISFILNLNNLNINAILKYFQHNLVWFWFLKTLVLLYIFNYLYNRVSFRELTGKIIIFLLLIFPFSTNLLWVFIIYHNPDITLPRWGLSGFFTLYSIVYYLSSKYFRLIYNWQMTIILILFGLTLNTFEVYVYSNYFHHLQDNVNAFFPTIGTLLMTIGIFNLVKSLVIYIPNSRFLAFVSWVGKNTLGIYIFHMPIILLLKRLIPVSVNYIVGIILCVFILLLSTFISQLIKSYRVSNWLLKI